MREITQDCPACGGTGRETGLAPNSGGPPTPYDNPCSRCQGVGKLLYGYLSEDLMTFLADLEDKVNDVKNKCNDIFEKLP